MGTMTCANCGAALRPQSRFCPKCATPIGGVPMAGPAAPPGGYTVRPQQQLGRPPIPGPRPGAPAPGTFVKEEQKRPGTMLYAEQEKGPVLGWLVLMKGRKRGTDYRISKESTVIGRDAACDVPLDDETASRQHSRVRQEGDHFVVFDLGSANGTFVNREKVQRHDLEDGDVIRVGEALLLFKEAKPGPRWTSNPAPSSESEG